MHSFKCFFFFNLTFAGGYSAAACWFPQRCCWAGSLRGKMPHKADGFAILPFPLHPFSTILFAHAAVVLRLGDRGRDARVLACFIAFHLLLTSTGIQAFLGKGELFMCRKAFINSRLSAVCLFQLDFSKSLLRHCLWNRVINIHYKIFVVVVGTESINGNLYILQFFVCLICYL